MAETERKRIKTPSFRTSLYPTIVLITDSSGLSSGFSGFVSGMTKNTITAVIRLLTASDRNSHI